MQCNPTVFDGLKAYEIVDEKWRMVVVTGCGPRIAFLGKTGGENILYWQKDGVIRDEYRLMGGHRVWLTRPMADESEDTYLSDNAPCRVEFLPNGLVATAPAHPFSRLERGMKIEWLGEGDYKVTNFVKNTGTLIYSGGVWSPTCIRPDGKVIEIPLGEDDVTWDIVKIVVPRVFAGNEVRLDDPQVTFEGNTMVVTPMGEVCKRCVKAPKGRVSMRWDEQGIRFTKHAPYVRHAGYPLGGCNLAVFVGKDNWMAELESFGAEQEIMPNQTIENTEYWRLEQ